MSYEKTFKDFQKKINAYSYALWLMSWDSQTETPRGAQNYLNQQRAILAEEVYNLTMDEKRIEAIDKLYETDLENPLKREIELEHQNLNKIKKIPKDVYLSYRVLLSNAGLIYKEAKEKSDFSLFEKTLDEIILYNKKLIKYLETDELKGYNVLLNDYHEGMKMEDYDKFFNLIKEKLVPFIAEVEKAKFTYPKVLKEGKFDIKKQREFNEYLLGAIKYDLNHGLLKESIHPFTSGVTSCDVRITTKYSEDDLSSAIFSTIHEMGHGIYEQQTNPLYSGTTLERIRSLGMHESQSRLYENMIGRSYGFWKNHYPKLQETFNEELKDVAVDDFYKYINEVNKSFIRVEADELTYSIHVMIRYEVEKAIFKDNLTAKEVKKLWNKLYKENLGLDVTEDKLGVLQDIHWSGGSFGYFPTYSLGSAIAAQFYETMKKELDIEKLIEEDNIEKINLWLKENIHQHGAFKIPNEIIKDVTKEEFDPNYYIDYLITKYKKIYNI